MNRLLVPASLLLLAAAAAAHAQSGRPQLQPGAIITRSVAYGRRTVELPNPADNGMTAAITIRGDDLTVDFGGSTLEGTPPETEPDARRGTGIRIEGRNVIVRNVHVRGYKIGLIAYDSPGLKLIDCDCSYNWKQRLASTLDREDGADWMSYHLNEQDEWLRYGAGVYLRRCDNFEVKGLTVGGGECGLMLMQCSHGLVWNSDLSFLSGIGLGMYRSSDNRILHDKIDWCVRGYSHGVYNRGQDSAGILVYEQSCRNVFAYDSVTHGGDGFFLWAGQTTMDTGTGGCNDNLVYGCDFSHAPTNGIEATFSRNTFANNLVMECWHGVWGGYSYDTKILGNLFAYDGEGIAIEHGQNNAIRGNAFYRDAAGIHVWQNEKQDPNWGYPKHHDTASHGYDVSGNVFTQIHRTRPPGTREIGGAVEGAAVELKATSDFDQGANRYGPVGALADVRGPLKSYRFGGARLDPALLSPAAARAQADHPSEWAWRRIESLGAGWQPSVEGRHMIGGPRDGFLPQLMKPDGNDILPYPDGEAAYRARFETDWNPLAAPKAVSIGAEPAGHALIAPTAETLALAPPPLPGGMDPYLKPGALRGRAYILVDQWGPYDFRAPRLWPRNTTEPGDAASLDLEVLGPRGSWTVRHVEGGTLSATSGKVPGRVELRRTGAGRVKIELEYLGGKTVDYRGIETPARRPVPFQYAEFKVPIDWHVRFYRYNKASQEPRTQIEAFRSLLSGAPLAQMDTTSLDLAPGRIPREVPNDYFATIAEGSFEIEPGDYVIDTTSDDGCRVYLDGKLLVDAWKYQVPTLYSKTVHLGGKHQLRVEHFQIDGYWTLKVAIRPAKP